MKPTKEETEQQERISDIVKKIRAEIRKDASEKKKILRPASVNMPGEDTGEGGLPDHEHTLDPNHELAMRDLDKSQAQRAAEESERHDEAYDGGSPDSKPKAPGP